MKLFKTTIIACSLALTGTAWAASGADSSYVKRTAPRFESFAGSSDNYSSLASGLRSGTQITLTGDGEKAVFTSPTKPMGYGNVTRAIDLAQRQLAAQGITEPTPSQLQTALMGGTITTSRGTVVYRGVLQMRADGMGWGQIAHSVGVHPGMGKSAAAVPASGSITSAAGGQSAAAIGKGNRPEFAGANGNARGQTRIATASGSGNSAAAAHANARGLGNSAAITSAAGANASGGASAAGGGNGNAFGRGK